MIIKSDILNKLLKKLDRICGTLEPTTRRIGFLRFAGQEYLYGTDGCFEGFLLLSGEGKIFQNYISPVEVPLDILKTFLKDVKGDVEISISTEDIFLKAYKENLKVRTGILDKRLDFTEEEFSKVGKNELIKKLDFVSGYLEEGNFVDLFFHPTHLELISHNYGITAYTKLPLETKRLGKLALPFVSVRHFVKTLELEENDEFLTTPVDEPLGIIGNSNGNYYRICASYLQHSSEKIAEVVRNFEPKAYVETERFSNMLKKSLVAGKFADVVVYSMDDELVVNSFQRGIVYKATTDMTIKKRISLSFKTKSYFLRSALTRIGSKKILLGTYDEYVILASLNRERFLVIRNER